MPWWAWIIAAYIAIIAIFLIRNWRLPHCPRCYYPTHRCECEIERTEDYDPHVARTLRCVEGGKL